MRFFSFVYLFLLTLKREITISLELLLKKGY